MLAAALVFCVIHAVAAECASVPDHNVLLPAAEYDVFSPVPAFDPQLQGSAQTVGINGQLFALNRRFPVELCFCIRLPGLRLQRRGLGDDFFCHFFPDSLQCCQVLRVCCCNACKVRVSAGSQPLRGSAPDPVQLRQHDKLACDLILQHIGQGGTLSNQGITLLLPFLGGVFSQLPLVQRGKNHADSCQNAKDVFLQHSDV